MLLFIFNGISNELHAHQILNIILSKDSQLDDQRTVEPLENTIIQFTKQP